MAVQNPTENKGTQKEANKSRKSKALASEWARHQTQHKPSFVSHDGIKATTMRNPNYCDDASQSAPETARLFGLCGTPLSGNKKAEGLSSKPN